MKTLKKILLREIPLNEISKEVFQGKKGGFIGKYYEPIESEIPEPETPLVIYHSSVGENLTTRNIVIFGKARIRSEEAKSNQEVEYLATNVMNESYNLIQNIETFIEYFRD